MNHDDWANTGVDLVNERQHAPPALVMFGTPLPQGTTEAQVQALLDDMGTLFVRDMGALKYPANLIGFAAKFYRQSALKPPRQVRANHNFELPSELINDWLANDFCNHLEGIQPGTKRQKQQFLTAAIMWLARLTKQLASQQQLGTVRGQETAQGSAPSTYGRPDDLDTPTYNRLYDYNEKMKPYTEGILREKWGVAYESHRRMVDEYLQSLSVVEKDHFDRFLNNGLHALNDPTVILGLYGQAVGINNIPRSGAALADEINMMQAVMKTHRKQWLADERMQSRYRELIRIRDGG
jgi:hypothetical protein